MSMEKRELFLEKGRLEAAYDAGGLSLYEKRVFLPGSQWLTYYQYGWSPLYLDKKGFAAHLSDEMEKRFVYLVEARSIETLASHGFSLLSLKEAREDTGPDDLDEDTKELYYEKIRELRRKIDAVNGELDEKLARHEELWDFKERWEHGSFYTSEQRYLMGEADIREYLDDQVFRTARKKDIEFKAFQEKSNLEYQIRQLEDEMRRARAAIRQEKRKKQDQKITAQLDDMRGRAIYTSQLVASVSVQAELVYHDGKLMAIYVPEQPRETYEITADEGWEPQALKGRILNVRAAEGRRAEYPSLYRFLIQSYGFSMKALKKLPPKPEGLSEEAWTMWIWLRQAQGKEDGVQQENGERPHLADTGGGTREK